MSELSFVKLTSKSGHSARGARRGVRQDRRGRGPGPEDAPDHQAAREQGRGPLPRH